MKSIEIHLNKFGQVFSSRPEGRETALSVIAYHLSKEDNKDVVICFEGVLIMTPSWLSEFIQTLKQFGILQIEYKNYNNASVISSIEMINEENLASGS